MFMTKVSVYPDSRLQRGKGKRTPRVFHVKMKNRHRPIRGNKAQPLVLDGVAIGQLILDEREA